MEKSLLWVAVVASVWDGFTTIYGTIRILGGQGSSILVAVIFAALIMSFLFNTKKVIYHSNNFAGALLRLLWFISIGYDIYTSWIGNNQFVVGSGATESESIVLIAGLTILVSGSPIVVSLLWDKEKI